MQIPLYFKESNLKGATDPIRKETKKLFHWMKEILAKRNQLAR